MDWEIIGHSWAVEILAGHIARGQERHAYLITGPQGVGRRTLALRFAQALNCLNPPAPGLPCLKCSSCKRIYALQHPDLMVVQAEHEGDVLRIDQVRELQHGLALAPYEARYRVALLLRFEEAHASASNAMLKILEEPPPQVVVMLTANNVESLLPTITSRCEVIRLRPLSVSETSHGLQTVSGLPPELADELAHISGGRPGYALRLYAQPELREQRRSFLNELIDLLASSRRDRFAFAAIHSNNRENLRSELQVWLTYWRDVLILCTGIKSEITNLDYAVQIEKVSGAISMDAARNRVTALETAINRIDRNVNARLVLEVLLLDFPRLKSENLIA